MYICPRQGGRTFLESEMKRKALEAKCVMGALPSKYMSLKFLPASMCVMA